MRRVVLLMVTAAALITAFGGMGHGDDSIQVFPDVAYATIDGTTLRLDVYRPAEPGTYPSVVAIHGGSWKGGDKTDWRQPAPAIARAGFVVFAAGYRLVPPGGEATHTDGLSDVRRAIRWVRANADSYGADPGRVSLLGSSAGAHLVLLAAHGETSARIDAVATWSPPVDLVPLARGSETGRVVRNYLGCPPRTCPNRYERMSPINRIASSNPPTFVTGSSHEVIPRRHFDALVAELRRKSVPYDYVIVPGSGHGQELRSLVLTDTIEFLDRGTAD